METSLYGKSKKNARKWPQNKAQMVNLVEFLKHREKAEYLVQEKAAQRQKSILKIKNMHRYSKQKMQKYLLYKKRKVCLYSYTIKNKEGFVYIKECKKNINFQKRR